VTVDSLRRKALAALGNTPPAGRRLRLRTAASSSSVAAALSSSLSAFWSRSSCILMCRMNCLAVSVCGVPGRNTSTPVNITSTSIGFTTSPRSAKSNVTSGRAIPMPTPASASSHTVRDNLRHASIAMTSIYPQNDGVMRPRHRDAFANRDAGLSPSVGVVLSAGQAIFHLWKGCNFTSIARKRHCQVDVEAAVE